jgi:hypothetical protein
MVTEAPRVEHAMHRHDVGALPIGRDFGKLKVGVFPWHVEVKNVMVTDEGVYSIERSLGEAIKGPVKAAQDLNGRRPLAAVSPDIRDVRGIDTQERDVVPSLSQQVALIQDSADDTAIFQSHPGAVVEDLHRTQGRQKDIGDQAT